MLKNDEEMRVLFFLGTAGCGKSSMASACREWLRQRGTNAMVANLDPGAERLPYIPDVDVREYVKLDEVMDTYGLGPNGAIIAAADLIAEDFEDILSEIETYDPDYLVVDTPGQLELFTFRPSGAYVVQALGKEKTIAVFLFDPFLVRTASSFTSLLLLSATTELRLGVPVARALSKCDMLSEEDMETIDTWVSEPDVLHDAVLSETGSLGVLASGLCTLLAETEGSFSLVKISAKEGRGMEDLYTQIQMVYEGGDDFIVPEP